MGSWTDLDARYDDGITPALLVLMILIHMDDTTAEEVSDDVAARVAGIGTVSRENLYARARERMQQQPIEQIIETASRRLNHEQQLYLLVHLADMAKSDTLAHLEQHPVYARVRAAFGVSVDAMTPYLSGILLKHRHILFPQ